MVSFFSNNVYTFVKDFDLRLAAVELGLSEDMGGGVDDVTGGEILSFSAKMDMSLDRLLFFFVAFMSSNATCFFFFFFFFFSLSRSFSFSLSSFFFFFFLPGSSDTIASSLPDLDSHSPFSVLPPSMISCPTRSSLSGLSPFINFEPKVVREGLRVGNRAEMERGEIPNLRGDTIEEVGERGESCLGEVVLVTMAGIAAPRGVMLPPVEDWDDDDDDNLPPPEGSISETDRITKSVDAAALGNCLVLGLFSGAASRGFGRVRASYVSLVSLVFKIIVLLTFWGMGLFSGTLWVGGGV